MPNLSPTEWLTLALVFITGFYAWQNRRMANEMKAARAVTILPKLVPSIKVVAPDVAWLRVSNAGPGPALDVDVSISLEPGDWEILWRAHIVAAAEAHDFAPKHRGAEDGGIVRLTALTQEFTHVRLLGRCRDALGGVHQIDERIEIREWWRVLQEANHIVDKDELHELRVEAEKLRKATEKMAGTLQRWHDAEWPDQWTTDFRWRQRVDRMPARLRSPAGASFDSCTLIHNAGADPAPDCRPTRGTHGT